MVFERHMMDEKKVNSWLKTHFCLCHMMDMPTMYFGNHGF